MKQCDTEAVKDALKREKALKYAKMSDTEIMIKFTINFQKKMYDGCLIHRFLFYAHISQ